MSLAVDYAAEVRGHADYFTAPDRQVLDVLSSPRMVSGPSTAASGTCSPGYVWPASSCSPLPLVRVAPQPPSRDAQQRTSGRDHENGSSPDAQIMNGFPSPTGVRFWPESGALLAHRPLPTAGWRLAAGRGSGGERPVLRASRRGGRPQGRRPIVRRRPAGGGAVHRGLRGGGPDSYHRPRGLPSFGPSRAGQGRG